VIVSALSAGSSVSSFSKRYARSPVSSARLSANDEPFGQSLESKKQNHVSLLDAEADLRVADETGLPTDLSSASETSSLLGRDTAEEEERPGMKEILSSAVVRSVLLSYACLAFVAVCHDAIWALW
jgi:hypothetical protein